MKERNGEDPASDLSPPVTHPAESPSRGASFPWKVTGGGALALVLIWFVLQNSHPVEVNLFWWSGDYPMILVVAGVAVAAIVVWETFARFRRRRKKRRGAVK